MSVSMSVNFSIMTNEELRFIAHQGELAQIELDSRSRHLIPTVESQMGEYKYSTFDCSA